MTAVRVLGNFNHAESNIVNDTDWMQHALLLAQKAQSQNEVPVAAIVVFENQIVGEGWNQPITQHDPTAHAEVMALRSAATKLHNYRLTDATLYVTLEPCVMCVGALIHARIKRLVFGALDAKSGAVASHFHLLDQWQKFNHRIEWEGGCLDEACGGMLKEFFAKRR
jgi:tRNA(adenine34) deaminase